MILEELRIGNLISTFGNIITKIEYISNWDNLIGSSNFCERGVEDFKPIKITEKWIRFFGFEDYSISHGTKELSIKSNIPSHHIVIRIGFYDSFFSVFNHSECDFTKMQYITQIRYVHQLQNLYFALTQEELILEDIVFRYSIDD